MSRDDGLSIEQTKEEFDDVRNRFLNAFDSSIIEIGGCPFTGKEHIENINIALHVTIK